MLLILGFLIALTCSATGHAAAHANLVGTQPAYGTVLQPGVGEVSVTFDEAVTVAGTGLTVLGRDGDRVAIGDIRYADGDRTIRAGLPTDLSDGTYLLSWVVLSADGHTIGGSSVFGVGVPPDTTLRAPAPDPLLAALDTMVRLLSALGYLGIVLGIGVPLVVTICGPVPVRRLALAGAVLIIATALAVLVLTPGRLAGAAGWTDASSWYSALTSTTGGAAVLRTSGAALLVTAARRTAPELGLRGPPERAGVAICGAVVVLVSSAVAGHAVAGPDRVLTVAVTTAHLAAMTVWGGGLVAALLLWRGAGRIAALRRFGPVAVGAVVVLVLTGVAQTVRSVDPPAALWNTHWGRLLLLKLALVAIALAVAALIRRRLRTDPTASARTLLRGETITLGAVLLTSAFLAGTAPARDTYDPPLHTTVALGEISAALAVDGTKAGDQDITVHLRDHAGAPLEIRDLAARLTHADGTVPLDVTFRRVTPRDRGPDYFTARTRVPDAGDWRLRLTVTVDRDTAHVATVPYRVY